MTLNGLDVEVFFSNSNITPLEEYDKRKAELIRYCDSLGVPYAEDEYDHRQWLEKVAKGREKAPERGERCLECFRFRLERAAEYAIRHNCSVLTTSLASSRWKDLEQVDSAGNYAVRQANDAMTPQIPLIWWEVNWRKNGLQPRRGELIKELGFYNQTFCGCEFSRAYTDNKHQ